MCSREQKRPSLLPNIVFINLFNIFNILRRRLSGCCIPYYHNIYFFERTVWFASIGRSSGSIRQHKQSSNRCHPLYIMGEASLYHHHQHLVRYTVAVRQHPQVEHLTQATDKATEETRPRSSTHIMDYHPHRCLLYPYHHQHHRTPTTFLRRTPPPS